MPIISDIGAMGNFFLNLIRIMIEKPIIFILFLLMILMFPLNVIDFLLSIFLNIFIILFNVIFWIVIIPVNILIFVLEVVVNTIVQIIISGLFIIMDFLGVGHGGLPVINLPNVPYSTLAYINIDLFGDSDTLLGLIVSALGLSFPIF